MKIELKYFIEENFDFLVKLYNRYIRYCLRKSTPLEYYASPYMNLTGYPSDKFLLFCTKYYNKKYNKNLHINISKDKIIVKLYLYTKLIFLFLFSFLFFSKNIKKNSVIIHAFHSDENFNSIPYRTIKSPPLEYFSDKNVYHDINLSFVSLKSLFKYKKNNIVFSLRYMTFFELMKLHYIALKVYLQNKSINKFDISYVDILYTLVKGVSIANLVNDMDKQSIYLHMWENRGYQVVTDFLINKKKKLFFLDLGIAFRLSPEYMMFNYLRHKLKAQFLFMSEYNYNLVKHNLGDINYELFKNYRIDCKYYKSLGKKNSILLIAPLSLNISKKLYQLIIDNKNLNIKIRLHPYIDKNNFKDEYLEHRNIYESLDDYNTIIYAGMTTAAIELFFQGKEIYKFISDEFIDIDLLVDEGLVSKIKSLNDILLGKSTKVSIKQKNYYMGCDNKNLKEILKEKIV